MRLVLDQGIPRDTAFPFARGRHVLRPRRRDWNGPSVGRRHSCMGTEAECNRRHAGADFHTILAVSGSAAPSVVRLRMQGLDALGAAGVVEKVMADFGEKLREGALVP